MFVRAIVIIIGFNTLIIFLMLMGQQLFGIIFGENWTGW